MRADALGIFWQDEPVIRVKKEPPPKRTPPEPVWLRPDYLPGLDEALEFNIPLFTDEELWQAACHRERLVFDIECYPNYFAIGFRSIVSGKCTFLEMIDGQSTLDTARLLWILNNFCIIGFNSNVYDVPIATIAAAGKNCDELQWATEEIITRTERPGDVLKRLGLKKLKGIDHIDLIEVAPLNASLKIYGGRLHCDRMQDLPFPPGTVLSDDQIAIVRWYLVNDLKSTELLYSSLKEQVSLREAMSAEYGADLRSRSDAQIAETVIAQEVERLNGRRAQRPDIAAGTVYRYRVPNFLRYQTPMMNRVLGIIANANFIVSEFGNIGMPKELSDLEIRIGDSVYRMGIGGLHSSEKTIAHLADEHAVIIDRDVTSYYPRIILNLSLYPQQLGTNFLRVYNTIVERRLHAKHKAKEAKKRGDKAGESKYSVIADSLKITINGSFGKFGNMYSVLYSPDLLIQVTVTGQLSLLMLIERLELAGIPVVSANTDGLVIKCPRILQPRMDFIVKQWEAETGFETEDTEYTSLYSRDVNNYIAVKPDGTVKSKGAYANPWSSSKNIADRLHKNPANQICVQAAIELLTKRTPLERTIHECNDIKQFVTVRTVKGGAVKNGEYLGKSIRWYYATGQEGSEIVYANSGNKVPRSDGAKPLMDLPTFFPEDVNYSWYVNESIDILKEIGYYS
jgi:hypothetical protein